MVLKQFSSKLENILSLSTLRPSQPINLAKLSEFLRNKKEVQPALPASLTEPMLLAVARELRALEEGSEDDPSMSLTAPMLLVLSLLLDSSQPGAKKDKVSVSDSTLWELMRVYQWAVEREIVTRITGVGCDDEKHLIERLSRCHLDAQLQ